MEKNIESRRRRKLATLSAIIVLLISAPIVYAAFCKILISVSVGVGQSIYPKSLVNSISTQLLYTTYSNSTITQQGNKNFSFDLNLSKFCDTVHSEADLVPMELRNNL